MTSRELADLIILNKDAITKAIPKAAQAIHNLETLGTRTNGCQGCALNKGIRLVSSILSSSASNPDDLLKGMDGRLRALFQPSMAHGRPRTSGGLFDRVACRECVVKHLSQALVLCDEVMQGYPEHVELAASHAREASMKSCIGDEATLRGAVQELSMKGDNLLEHLNRARDIMEGVLKLDRPVWRLIGHLAEAADECVKENPDLAMLIRTERLQVMDDPSYKPDINLLLEVASGMVDKKGNRA